MLFALKRLQALEPLGEIVFFVMLPDDDTTSVDYNMLVEEFQGLRPKSCQIRGIEQNEIEGAVRLGILQIPEGVFSDDARPPARLWKNGLEILLDHGRAPGILLNEDRFGGAAADGLQAQSA